MLCNTSTRNEGHSAVNSLRRKRPWMAALASLTFLTFLLAYTADTLAEVHWISWTVSYNLLATSIMIGILATFTMDLSSLIGRKLKVIMIPYGKKEQNMMRLLGRWTGNIFRGRLTNRNNNNILNSQPLRGEPIIGILSHYA